MAEQSVTIDLDAAPEAAWAVLGDFFGLGEWFPGVESCRAQGDVRVLEMLGMEVREQLIARDDHARSLTYSIISGVPLERHRATVSVTSKEQGSQVEWAVEVEPDSMLPVLAGAYEKALRALRERLF